MLGGLLFRARLLGPFLRQRTVLIERALGFSRLADAGLLVSTIVRLLLVAHSLRVLFVRLLFDALGSFFGIDGLARLSLVRFLVGFLGRDVARLHVRWVILWLARPRLRAGILLRLLRTIGRPRSGIASLGRVLAVRALLTALAACPSCWPAGFASLFPVLVLVSISLRRVLLLLRFAALVAIAFLIFWIGALGSIRGVGLRGLALIRLRLGIGRLPCVLIVRGRLLVARRRADPFRLCHGDSFWPDWELSPACLSPPSGFLAVGFLPACFISPVLLDLSPDDLSPDCCCHRIVFRPAVCRTYRRPLACHLASGLRASAHSAWSAFRPASFRRILTRRLVCVRLFFTLGLRAGWLVALACVRFLFALPVGVFVPRWPAASSCRRHWASGPVWDSGRRADGIESAPACSPRSLGLTALSGF